MRSPGALAGTLAVVAMTEAGSGALGSSKPKRLRGRPASTSSSRRHPRATAPRKRELTGPLREVVHIFDRVGPRGGAYWLLVLDCGHLVARPRHVVRHWTALTHALFEPIEKRFAPRSVQCHFFGSGVEKHDPAVLIKALT